VIRQPDPTPQREAIRRLDFMVGEWTGESWFEMIPGQRQTLQSWELVRPMLGGTVLMVEGRHSLAPGGAGAPATKEAAEPQVVHEAIAIVSFDPFARTFRFRSWLANGRDGAFEGKAGGRSFTWSMRDPRGADIRHTLVVSEAGDWVEKGEMSEDGGETWRQFMEMQLRKITHP
jgi:hypothetical protein